MGGSAQDVLVFGKGTVGSFWGCRVLGLRFFTVSIQGLRDADWNTVVAGGKAVEGCYTNFLQKIGVEDLTLGFYGVRVVFWSGILVA